MAADDLQSKAADLMKKVLTVGVGTIFLTEESLRSLVSEFKLPKEMLTAMLESAQRTKDDFLQKLSSEVLQTVLSKVDLKQLIQELGESNELDLRIQVKLNPKKKSD